MGDDMAEIDRATFDGLMEPKYRNAPEVREIFDALRRIATEGLGRVSEHPSGAGDRWGTSFKIDSGLVFRADPWPEAGHVGIRIPKADQKSLEGLGQVHVRKNGDLWVHVTTLKSIDRIRALVDVRYEQLTGTRPPRAPVRSTAEAAKPSPWTPPELELVIKDYFAMRDEEAAGGADQAAHNRALIPLLQNRTMDTVESIRAQISQVLLTQGLPYIDGYQPRGQAGPPVELLVLAFLDAAPAAPQPVAETTPPTTSPAPSTDFDHVHRLVEAAPPAQTEREGRAVVRLTVMRTDYMLRDAKNRELGIAGEQSVVDYERRRLVDEEHRPDLVEHVEWVAQTQGDGLGYDVLSFDGDGQPRLIEVKTTNLSDNTPFFVTRNEVDVSTRERTRYYLYRVFAFNSNPRVFILHGALAETCALTPTVFSARARC
jgi:hypothetical protein